MRRMKKNFAALAVVAMVAAACGGDDASDAPAEEPAAEEADAPAEEASEEPAEETGGAASEEETADALAEASEESEEEAAELPTTIEGWQELWAAERAEIIATAESEGWGLGDDGILVGPAGFTIDTNECPEGWNNDEGLDDGVITIGVTTANSGSLAVYGNIYTGLGAYFDMINDQGGIGGYTFEVIVKDDEYVATKTIEAWSEFFQSTKPLVGHTLGSPNTFSVQPEFNAQCVPQVMVATGHQAWGDPVNHPWTTGYQLSYASEALLWGAWIEANTDPGVVVAGLVMDNDFGLAYEQAFKDFADNSDHIDSFEIVRHDPASATLTNEVTTLAATNPDIFISMTAGNPCVLAIQEAGRSGIIENAQAVFTPSVCKSIAAYMDPAGEDADGWYIVGGGIKDTTDAGFADDLWISYANEKLDEYGGDSSISLQGEGFANRGPVWEQVLRIAAELDGGINRTNIMLAQRGLLTFTHPALLDGIKMNMNGNSDAYFVEGSDISQYDLANRTWVKQGGTIDLSGLSPNCAWVPGEGC